MNFLSTAILIFFDSVKTLCKPRGDHVYHLPNRLKKAGKLLLKAATEGEYAYIKNAVGHTIVYDFDRVFFYNLTAISKYLNNLHLAFTKVFSAINSRSSTDLIRSIGRLDAAIAAFVDAHEVVNSYELEEGEFKELEQSGLELLTDALASLIQYAVEVEADLGKQLLETERVANEYPESLSAGKHTITLNFDSSKSIDKLSVLLEWYKSYKDTIAADENELDVEYLENSEELLDPVDPVDTAVLGYMVGSGNG